MVVAPVARRIKIAGPDAQPVGAGSRLLGAVAARIDGQSFGHHDAAKVSAGNRAGGEQAIILVHALGTAIGRASGQQFRQPAPRGLAAGPGSAIGVGAILLQFGRIEAEQANTVLVETKAVAIAGARLPRDGRRRLIQRGGDQGQNGQNGDRQQRATGAAKDGAGRTMSTQDFTAR
jgi:hypothetical protein